MAFSLLRHYKDLPRRTGGHVLFLCFPALLCSALHLCVSMLPLLSYPGINQIFFILLNRNFHSLPRSESSKAHCHFAHVLLSTISPLSWSRVLFVSIWHQSLSQRHELSKKNPLSGSPISLFIFPSTNLPPLLHTSYPSLVSLPCSSHFSLSSPSSPALRY